MEFVDHFDKYDVNCLYFTCRVNIPNSNYKEFGKAFSCKMEEDSMYPKEAEICRVW